VIQVIGVNYKLNGKVYHFSPGNCEYSLKEPVVVETERGEQLGFIATEPFEMEDEKLKSALSRIIRKATDKDLAKNEKNIEDAKKALKKCRDLIDKYKLKMYIIDASYTLDRSQLFFRFMADERVDFRSLAKDLATIYKTRIELRQIGVRDKAKEVGGYGSCGRPLCCAKYLSDFDSVSINMAKNQNIALNPTKINGVCGRLLCCLKYEDECYKDLRQGMPKVGKKVQTEQGEGKVISIDILKGTYRVNIPDVGIVELEKEKNEG